LDFVENEKWVEERGTDTEGRGEKEG